MTVFDFDEYREFLTKTLKSMPKRGHGQMAKLAQHLSTSPVIVSQVMSQQRDFTYEQAHDVADFFGLNELEKEFFLLLVQFNRAGNHRLKKYLQEKIKKLKDKSNNLKERIKTSTAIGEEATARFYSNWYYAAISLYVILPGEHTAESIADYFQIPLLQVRDSLEFLCDNELVLEKNSKYYSGPKHTHLSKNSPYISNHHRNWRNKSIERSIMLTEDELCYTFPMAISVKDRDRVRSLLMSTVEKINKIAQATQDEELICLNIDLFKY